MIRHIVSANRLSDGRVVFHGTGGWSLYLADAASLATAEEAAALAAVLDQPSAGGAAPVVGVHGVALGEDGLPVLLRERIRILGPTVRPDLAKPLEA